jgi:acyl-CoA thioester hydrolase
MDSGSQCASLLPGYPVRIAVPVQWGDQDAFGHVNNTVPFRWFESARVAYNQGVGLLELFQAERIGTILAATACDFRRPINFPDTVHVGVRAVRIGRTSIAMEHAIVSERDHGVAALGTATIVVFDYKAGKPHPVPATIRQAIEALEGHAFE